MIFRSTLSAQLSQGAPRPAMEAIAAVQRQAAPDSLYVTLPDHARLAGQIAAALDTLLVPNLRFRPDVLRAISLHDIGWAPLTGDFSHPLAPAENAAAPHIAPSFLATPPSMFLPAWAGSIQAAQECGALGQLLVAAHFARLARIFLEGSRGNAAERQQVETFMLSETARIDRLLPQAGVAADEIAGLLEALQFCDLCSLYLCANPSVPGELPQSFAGQRCTLSFSDGSYRLTPTLLDQVVILEIPCLRWIDGRCERQVAPIRLQ